MSDNNNWDNLDDGFGSDWNLDLDFEGVESEQVDAPVAEEPARPSKKIAKTAGDADFPKLDIPVYTGNKNERENAVSAEDEEMPRASVSQIRARRAEEGTASGKKPAKKPAGKKGGKDSSKILLLIVVILAVLLVIFLAVKLLGKGGKTPEESTTAPEQVQTTAAPTEATWLQNSNQDVLSLVNRYYAALTQVDFTTLEQILDSGVVVNQSKVESEAAVVEGYQDICCYITDGMNEGEYAVYVSFLMKIKNISTPAPGLVPCYVNTDSDGNLRLIPWSSIEGGGEIFDYLGTVAECEAIKQLAASVTAAFQEAKDSDETLKAFLNALQGETEPAEEDTTAAEDGEETTTAAESSSATTDQDGFTATDDTMYVTTKVKCRYKPNTSDDTEFKVVEAGTAVQVTGIGSGDWNKVCLPDGTKGYIMKQFLTTDKPQ